MISHRFLTASLSASLVALACSGEETSGSSPNNNTGGGGSSGDTSASGGSHTAGTSDGGSPPGGQPSMAGTAGTGGNPTGGAGGVSGGGEGGTAGTTAGAGGTAPSAAWPDQKVAAVSLTYDDGLDGQLKYALPALDGAGFKGTFFLASFQGVPHAWSLPNTTDPLNARHEAWQTVLANGHELASHTVYHPCDDNNPDYQPAAYDLDRMALELDDSIARLTRLGAEAPLTFAYPCGGDQRGVGPEDMSVSYAPEVDSRFLAARISMSGVADPTTIDLHQVSQYGTTDATGAELIAHIDEAITAGAWVVFTFHGVGPEDTTCDINTFDLEACALNYLTTADAAHQELVNYLVSKEAEVWVAPFKEVATHIAAARP